MSLNFACQNAPSSAIRRSSHATNRYAMPVLALLALLCGMTASLQAQTASYSGITSPVNATDFAGPQGITTDATGTHLFVADNSGIGVATVYEMTRSGPGAYGPPLPLPAPSVPYTCPPSITPTSPCLRGLALDANGNLWVADFGNGTSGQVYEFLYVSGAFQAPVPVGTGWIAPWGIAADNAGNVFVTDDGVASGNSIFEITNSGGTPTVTPVNNTGIAYPRGIAVNSAGDLFVIDGNTSQVVKLTAASSYTAAVAINGYGFQGPGDIAIDASGNIWVAEYSTGFVRMLTFGSNYSSIYAWGTGLNGPVAVWPSPVDGTILVSDNSNVDNSIQQIGINPSIGFGTVALGSASGTQTLTFAFPGSSSTAIGAPVVTTLGAASLDFTDAGTGTCTTSNGSGNPWASLSTCTVIVKFQPTAPGIRYGAVELRDTSGNFLAEELLYGVGTGPQLVFNPGLGTAKLATLTLPQKVAVDGSGNVFVVDAGTSQISEIPALGGGTVPVAAGHSFSVLYGIAVDGAGNLFVSESGANQIDEILSAGGYTTVLPLLPGFGGPVALSLDADGNLYVADASSTHAVEEITRASDYGVVRTLSTAFSNLNPFGVAVDGNGNVFAADKTSTSITELVAVNGQVPDSPTTRNLGSFTSPISVAVDAGGNLYVADLGAGTITELTAASNFITSITLATGLADVAGVAVDNKGNVYYTTNASDNSVYKIDLADPPSLIFASTAYQTLSTDSPQAVTLTNIGNGASLDLSALTATPSSFTLGTTAGDCTATTSLAGGASCTLSVSFTPQTVAGSINGTATVTDNTLGIAGTSQIINLTGSSTQAAATVVAANATASYNATAQNVTLTATVTAPGVADINEGTVAFTVAGITGTSTSPTVVNGAASVTYSIPAAQGAGPYSIHAVYSDASGNFSSSTDTTHTLTIGLADQSPLTVNVTSPATYNTTQTLTATGGNGTGTVTFSAGGSTACSVSGATLTITAGTGTCAVTATKAADSNYNAITSTPPTTVTVQTAAQSTLTVHATSPADYNSTQTLTATGGDGTGALTFSAGVSTACSVTGATLTITSGTGTCSVTATRAADNNYSPITSTAVTVTVQKIDQATLTVHAASPATYNTTQTLTATGGNGTGALTFSAAGTACSVAGATLTITSGTGTCSVTATQAADANYNAVTSTAATVTVQKAAQSTLTVIATSPAAYNSTQTLTTTGGSGTGALTFSAGASTACSVSGAVLTITSGTGTCLVTATQAADANYNAITSTATTVTVQKATQSALTVNATSPATYNSTQTLTATGGSGTGAVTFSAGASTACSLTGAVLTITSGTGTCSVTATQAADANYNAITSTPPTTVTVTGATLTLTVNAASRVYGAADPTYTGTFVGLQNGDTVTPDYTTTATVTSPVGTYPITATISGAKASNYTLTVNQGTLTITKAPLAIAVNSATRVYGAANPGFSGTVTGLVAGDTSLTVVPNYSTAATITSPVGTYPITATLSGTSAGNYTLAVTPGTLTITQASTSVTWAAPAPIVYGTPLSATQLNATASVAGSFAYTPAAGTILPVGAGQLLSVTFTPTDTVNYTPSSATTAITVAVTGLTVSANNATRVYGTANPAFAGTITGAQNGDAFTESFTTAATIASNAGTYAIVPSASGPNLASYTVAIDNGTLTVTKANTTTGLSTSGSSVNPGASVTLTATVASATSGTPTGSVSFYDGATLLGSGTLTAGVAAYSTTALGAGASHTLTAVYSGDVNFNTSSTSASTDITVGALDFTLGSPTPASQSGAGGTAFTYSFDVSPVYGTYAGDVSFTATGLPSGAAATFSPSTIPANGGPQTVTMIVNTAAGSAALVRPATTARGLIPIALAFLFLPLAGTRRMRRHGRKLGRLACLLLLVLAGLGATTALTGCGSHAGFSGTTAQTYTITVTATSGAIQHTSTVTLDLK